MGTPVLGNSVRLSLLSAAIFVSPAVFIPFWPVFLDHRGFDATMIGGAFAIGNFVRALLMPAAGVLADRFGRLRLPLAVICASAILSLLGFGLVEGLLATLILIGIMNAMWGPIIPLSDVLTLRVAATDATVDYGRVRLWGSIAFLATGPLAGWFLTRTAPDAIPVLCAAGIALVLPILLLVPDPPAPRRSGSLVAAAKAVFGHPPLAWMFLVAGLAQGSHMMLYGFGSLTWSQAGLSSVTIGALWAVGVAAEIVLFWVGRPILRRLGPVVLFQWAGLAALVRWSLFPLVTDPALLVVLQVLHAGTFGASHLAAIEVLRAASPPDRAASAATLYAAVPIAFGGGLLALGSGWLFEWAGPHAFWAMAVLGAVTVVSARYGLGSTQLTPPR
ncbi:MAG: MFS transporter [Alphaproteobacteria bacterium]|nr:MFS transporter [Alphaproteobacteria bacterium]